MRLPEIVAWVGKDLSRRYLRMRGIGHGQQPDFVPMSVAILLRHEESSCHRGTNRRRPFPCPSAVSGSSSWLWLDQTTRSVTSVFPVFCPRICQPRAVGRPLRDFTNVIVSPELEPR